MTMQREYEKSHPWINFRLDLRRAPSSLWVLIGQAVAHCGEVAAATLPLNQTEKMNELYLIKGVQATTAIEGNTLTEEQIRARYEGAGKLPPSREYQGREVDNIMHIYKMVDKEIFRANSFELRPELICEYNRFVLEGLGEHLEDGIVPGEIPKRPVGVGRYLGAPREDCMYLLERLCNWLRQDFDIPFPMDDQSKEIARAVLRGFMAHLYIAWIHPFGDGNGRTARLLEYILLARGGTPTLSAHLPSNHYNLTRDEYYRQLDRASKKNDVFGFLHYALQGFVDGLQEQCQHIHNVQIRIAWDSYIGEFFRQRKDSAATRRQREIMFALDESFVPRAEIANLNPEVARLYADKTDKTLTRDLDQLVGYGLAERGTDGYRARIERMLAFRPIQINTNET